MRAKSGIVVSRRRVVVVVAVAMSLGLGTAGAGAQAGPPVLPSRQLSTEVTPIRAFSQPEVAVHPGDPRTVVVIAANFFAGSCHTYVSHDRGRTWSEREARPQPQSPPSCARPAFGAFLDVAFGADGTLYFAGAASTDKSSTGPTHPYVARSDDLGETWEITFLADGDERVDFTDHEGVTRQDTRRFTNTRMAVHPTDPDILYVGYRYQSATLGFSQAPRRTMIAVSRDGGRTFSELTDAFANLAASEVYGSDQPALAVARDGTVHAFTKERPAPGAEGFPRLLQTTSTDEGRTWEGRVLDPDVAICGPCLTTPEAAIDPDAGTVYVVFELSESPAPNARADRDIFVKVSTDGGSTFTDRVRLNDGLDPNRVPDNNQMFPGIAIAPNGRVDVTWYDFRSDRVYNSESKGLANHRGDLYWDVYYTFSTDRGATWASNVRISDRSMHRERGYAMHPSHHLGGPISVASSDSQAHVAWSDSRNGTFDVPAEDVYYTSVLQADPGTSDSSISGSSVVLGAALGLALAGAVAAAIAFALRSRPPAGAPSARAT